MKQNRREFNKWLDNITDQFPDEREPNGCYDKSCCDSYKGQLASAYYDGFQDGAERVYSDFDLNLKEENQELRQRLDKTFCPCGGVILADTENLTTPLCYYCHEELTKELRQRLDRAESLMQDAAEDLETICGDTDLISTDNIYTYFEELETSEEK